MFTDNYFRVELLNSTPRPQWTCFMAAHQDYCSDFVYDQESLWKMTEKEAGQSKAIQKCMKHGHFGVFEHPQLIFNVGYFPHDVMVQARTHRTGISFDVMSQRYTSQHILDIAKNKKNIEEVFYFQPTGYYDDRHGHKYTYTDEQRNESIRRAKESCEYYAEQVLNNGVAPEQARRDLPQNIRQHFVVSMNMRTLMHFVSLRMKADAQGEIQQMAYLLNEQFKAYAPDIAQIYNDKIQKQKPTV